MDTFVEQTVADVRKRVGKNRVICGLSGGVDSSVVAALLLRAVGPQVACIFVDNGLLRQGEADKVRKTFAEWYKADLHMVDARERFLNELKGIVDPQQKRKIIGRVFIDVFKDEALHIEDARFLAQGTLYPDVIESGGAIDGPAATIKTHHNVGGLPKELGFELIEPLRDLFKDEVRRVGAELGLPDEVIWRHPFPGPGLAVRCLGEVTQRTARHPAPGRCDISRRTQGERLVPQNGPGLFGPAAGAKRRRHGRWPHLRKRRGLASRPDRRLHDRRLVAPAR